MVSVFAISWVDTFAVSTNPFIAQLEATSAWWITASGEIMDTPIWGLIYFVIGMSIIATIATIIIGIIMWWKSHTK